MARRRASTGILPILAAGISIVLVPAASAIVETTTRVSVSSGGAQANANSALPAISGDGQFVAFESAASSLAAPCTTGVTQIFARDRGSNATSCVSLGLGGAPGNAPSSAPVLSADGRFVAFSSEAVNLVVGDTNGFRDVFVRDLQLGGPSRRVSVDTGGSQANGPSSEPAISSDGVLVAFSSTAGNLVAGDTNGLEDVFVRARRVLPLRAGPPFSSALASSVRTG